MTSFFSCFACGSASADTTSIPVQISASKVMPQPDQSASKIDLNEYSDIKSRSATTMTFMTTDSFPTSSIEDEESYISKKIQQIRKKDLPERKAMESEFIKQNLSKSAVICLVEKEWSELYTAFLKNIDIKELRPLNNSKLVDSKNILRTDIREKDDYFIINERVWKFVQQMYGGGPAILQDMFFPVVALSNRKVEIPIVGITNPMYHCYMISVLQCLLSNQHFAHHFLKKLFDDSKRKMICHSLISKLSKQAMQSNSTRIDIKQLGMLFESSFNSTEQHDAHEFFVHFCNMLQEEGKTENTVKSCEGKSSEAVYSHYFKNNKSIVDRLFVGQTEAVVECVKCQVKSVTYDAFIDIQLDLMDSTLENCLKRRFESDKIEGYDCESCKKKTKAFKKQNITKTPNYLVLTLKKFTANGRKIEDRVRYPNELNLKHFCKGHSGDSRYVLQSILVHKGTKCTKGHYYCYTHRSRKTWHYASDDLIKPIDHQDVFGRDAYMLFYERVK